MKQTINLTLPIKITKDDNGFVITDANQTEFFFLNQEDKEELFYDGFCAVVSNDSDLPSGDDFFKN